MLLIRGPFWNHEFLFTLPFLLVASASLSRLKMMMKRFKQQHFITMILVMIYLFLNGQGKHQVCANPSVTHAQQQPQSKILEDLIGVWLKYLNQELSQKNQESSQNTEISNLKVQIENQEIDLHAQSAWITTPLHTRAMIEALLALKGDPKPAVAHSLSLAALAPYIGVELYDHRSSPKTSGYFPHLSQAGALWLAQAILQDHRFFGVDLKSLLVKLYGHQLAQLAIARTYLIEQDRLDFEAAAYRIAMEDLYFQGPAYLRMRFAHVKTGYATEKSPDYVALGFWLRREIDGSASILWKALEDLLPVIESGFPQKLKEIRFEESPRSTFDAPITEQELSQFYELILQEIQSDIDAKAVRFSVKGSALKLLRMGFALTSLPMFHGRWKDEKQGWRALAKGLPYPLFQALSDEENGTRPFKYYHPRLIQWATEQLIPPADLTVMGIKASELYDLLLKPTIDQLVATYLILHQDPARRSHERFEFMMALMSKQNPTQGLKVRFQKELQVLQTQNLRNPERGLAFWLRREIDGSAPILWGALRLILHRFDPQQAQSLRQHSSD